jgi:RimJ/RimL family protein N-acetyltransferase
VGQHPRLSGGSDSIGGASAIFAAFMGHWGIRGYAPLAFVKRGGADVAAGIAGPDFAPDWPEVELGWQLWNASLEGQGYAFEAADAVRRWCVDTYGWTRMVSYIKEGNTRSEKVRPPPWVQPRRLGDAPP